MQGITTGRLLAFFKSLAGKAVAEKVPDAPAEDGTYVLVATVDDGTVTYSWESAN